MAEGINVRFTGPLHRFIQMRAGAGGLYQSASEYIRDLVRHDYEAEQARCSEALYQELLPSLQTPLSEYVPLDDVETLLRKSRERRAK